MKHKIYPFLASILFLFNALGAAAGEPVIPTEVSEPPYSVGDLVMEQGYYIDRGEGETRINLRFFENRLRLYWIDENGLIAEPESSEATVRFLGTIGTQQRYNLLVSLPEGAGLGAPGLVPPPHIFNLILHIPASGERGELTHNIRYIAALNEPVDPTQGE
ncbi:MAG: hypothetical protein EA353_11265 [Puniceicoccaceae bacterium]|nr:MAG: hypothetical protein EA353_11265 [Puniceicoccaceae bacterium]